MRRSGAAKQPTQVERPAAQLQSGQYELRVRAGDEVLGAWRGQELEPYGLNRDIDEARVRRMLAGQLTRRAAGQPYDLGPAPIVVAVIAGRGFVVDGGHRLSLLARLPDPEHLTLLLAYRRCACQDEVDELFERVNLGAPVPSAFYDKKVKSVLSRCFDQLMVEWPGAASTAEHPRRPRFNAQRAVEQLSERGRLRDAIRDGDATTESLLEASLSLNVEARSMYRSSTLVPPACLAAARKTGCWVGLDAAWLERLVARALSKLGPPEEEADEEAVEGDDDAETARLLGDEGAAEESVEVAAEPPRVAGRRRLVAPPPASRTC